MSSKSNRIIDEVIMSDDKDYNKREIDKYHEGIDLKLAYIEKQVTITNGRVTKLEKWQAFITGGLTILSVMVIPLVIWVVNNAL